MSNNHEEKGWVLKLPYVTNKDGLKYVNGLPQLLAGIESHSEHYGRSVSYTMLQPRMCNAKEHKLVLFDGKFSHLMKNASQGMSFITTQEQKERAVKFAEDCVQLLRARCPVAITNGLLRVDLFRDATGSYRVNELESLEARYWAGGRGGQAEADELSFTSKLVDYWRNEIEDMIK